MYAWFCFNGLAINRDKFDKSRQILFGSWQRLQRLQRAFPLLSSTDLAGTAVPL